MPGKNGGLLVCGIRIKDRPGNCIASQQPMHHSGLHLTVTIPVDGIPNGKRHSTEVTFDMLPQGIRDTIGNRNFEAVNVRVYWIS